MSSADIAFMARALQLAERGLYTTHPNPRVGCVIVRDGQIVGEGYHQRAGEPHAEVHALRQAGDLARGATAYVTLEPCAHHGRTPPCADALVKAGLARVVAAVQDSNPLVGGQGFARLQAAGIATAAGVLESEARALNAGFLRRMAGGLPWVRVKLAMSLDGRTGMPSGESKWITGPAARRDVQRLRARSGAIITGVGTVLADDPSLTVRPAECPDWPAQQEAVQPLRVILDSRLRTPANAGLLRQPGRTIIVTLSHDAERTSALQAAGAEIWVQDLPQIDPRAVLECLAAQQINEVLVEAGPTVSGAFVAAGLVDELVVYQAPTLLGSLARPLVELPLTQMADQLRLRVVETRQLGDDLRWILRPA